MHFDFILKDINFEGELLYVSKEHSLLYRPFSNNAGIVVVIGEYTGLDVICETGVAVHISGLCFKNKWINKKMKIPKSKKGCLITRFEKPPIKGTGIDYGRTWKTYFDKNTNCICIGDDCTKCDDNCIEFANNIIAVLRNGQLIAVWAKIQCI